MRGFAFTLQALACKPLQAFQEGEISEHVIQAESAAIGLPLRTVEAPPSADPAERDKIISAIHMTFRRVQSVGALDVIQRMDRFTFAESLGAIGIRISHVVDLGAFAIEYFPSLFAVDGANWDKIKRWRAGESGLELSASMNLLGQIPEVQGPGIYYVGYLVSGDSRIEKSAFVHEQLELEASAESLFDPVHAETLNDWHPLVMEGELRFASLMGDKELEISRRHLADKKLPIVEQKRREAVDPQRRHRLEQIRDFLQNLYTLSGGSAFREESLEMWEESKAGLSNPSAAEGPLAMIKTTPAGRVFTKLWRQYQALDDTRPDEAEALLGLMEKVLWTRVAKHEEPYFFEFYAHLRKLLESSGLAPTDFSVEDYIGIVMIMLEKPVDALAEMFAFGHLSFFFDNGEKLDWHDIQNLDSDMLAWARSRLTGKYRRYCEAIAEGSYLGWSSALPFDRRVRRAMRWAYNAYAFAHGSDGVEEFRHGNLLAMQHETSRSAPGRRRSASQGPAGRTSRDHDLGRSG